MKITVRRLIEDLSRMTPDDEVVFGCRDGLSFYQVKNRKGYVQIEFEETVYRDDSGELVISDHRREGPDASR